ncbi:sigma-70 family RNA polymerase sigma factor [Hassallia byssoidea VB512170]|uniref:Sigma-70 family RNA polymerase sigma factor n=1 Tax=Hassallia byssoidea VB512170 TaxID=1304833 RepID=A0A846HDK7_9CYAN|nr:hypothetical protein [Hassalia byssoidea]NEU75038.1 sigma-70 family RNA polymerase sigma factor [Hassalia byssoidea VB512170]
MKKREDIVEKFSTFLSFGNANIARNLIWHTDPELERYIKRLVKSEPEANKEFWARYFLKILTEVSHSQSREAENKKDTRTQIQANAGKSSVPSSSIAGRHLSAYLQEACLWASQKTYQRFKFLRHKYPLEEYFQIANSAANPPAKLFKNFNLEHPQTNIEGYAKTALVRFVSNTIYRQDIEAKREKFSDYGLLKHLTNKELREALTYQGINNNQILSYCLVWQCLDEIYQPNQSLVNRNFKYPSETQLTQITFRYNQRQNQLNSSTATSVDKIQDMLSTCIKAARDYRTKRFLPLEQYDTISDLMPTPWDTLLQQEASEQVQSLIWQLFSNMPEAGQIIFQLLLGLNLTQIEIVAVLKTKYPELQKQYQVARHLARYNKNLLKDLANEWQKINPEVCLNDDKDIERIKDAMGECLQSLCQNLLYSTLDKIEEQCNHSKKLSTLTNEINMLKQPRLEPLIVDLSEASNMLREIKQNLIDCFQEELEINMILPKTSLKLVEAKIEILVDEWIKGKLYVANKGEVR